MLSRFWFRYIYSDPAWFWLDKQNRTAYHISMIYALIYNFIMLSGNNKVLTALWFFLIIKTWDVTHFLIDTPPCIKMYKTPSFFYGFLFFIFNVICSHSFQTVMPMWLSRDYHLKASMSLRCDTAGVLSREWLRLSFKEICMPLKGVCKM